MSRLESFRRRVTAQIDGLNWAATEIAGLEGDVLELGLGNGRTYDHLREYLPERDIWVVDRVFKPNPLSAPPEAFFLKGEALAVLPQLAKRGVRIALAHYDFGYGVKEKDVAEGKALSPLIVPLLVPGGIVVSQQPIVGLTQVRGPETVDPDRYHFYRKDA